MEDLKHTLLEKRKETLVTAPMPQGRSALPVTEAGVAECLVWMSEVCSIYQHDLLKGTS